MAGAAKRRNKSERQAGQAGQAGSQQLAEPSLSASSATPPPSENLLPGGLDGPSDDRSTSGCPPHGFGPSMGYDPARSNAAVQPNVPRRLELPVEAYWDSTQVSSIQTNLSTLYKIAKPNSLANSLSGLLSWLATLAPLHYPAPNPFLYIPTLLSSTFDFLHPSYQTRTPLILKQHPTQSSFYHQHQSSIQAILLIRPVKSVYY